jgi:hypothetical protein
MDINTLARPHLYRLEGTTPVAMSDEELLEWGRWFQKADRIVKQEYIGPYFVSTVFLGTDYNFAMQGPPILFETMIFCDGEGDLYQDRCSTWDEALMMHQRGVEWAAAKEQ